MLYVVLLIQQFIASSTHLIAKDAASRLHPVSLVLVRGTLTCLAFGAWFLMARRRWKPVAWRDVGLILGLGFVNLPINQLVFTWGVSHTTPPNASLAYAMTPAFVASLMIFVQRRSLSPHKLLGIFVAFVGAAIVLVDRGADVAAGRTLGNVLVLVASFSWAVFTLYGRPLIERYGPIQASAMTFFAGLATYIPLWLLMPVDGQLAVLWRGDATTVWWQLVYLGVVTSGIGYALWYYALGRLDSGKVAVFSNMQPVLTSVLAFVFLGQTPSPAFVVGGCIALLGVIVTQRS
jgi:drug/metabolite transporter (DMT)-like permease